MGVNAVSNTIEILVDGTLYRCYAARRTNDDEGVERYIVAGVGSITIARDTGAIVTMVAVIPDGVNVLAELAPILHARTIADTKATRPA